MSGRIILSTRLPADEVDLLDRLRGVVPRSSLLRHLVVEDLQAGACDGPAAVPALAGKATKLSVPLPAWAVSPLDERRRDLSRGAYVRALLRARMPAPSALEPVALPFPEQTWEKPRRRLRDVLQLAPEVAADVLGRPRHGDVLSPRPGRRSEHRLFAAALEAAWARRTPLPTGWSAHSVRGVDGSLRVPATLQREEVPAALAGLSTPSPRLYAFRVVETGATVFALRSP